MEEIFVTVEAGKYIDVKGVQTHYHEDGQGEVILLIHGSGPGVSAWANWRLVFRFFHSIFIFTHQMWLDLATQMDQRESNTQSMFGQTK